MTDLAQLVLDEIAGNPAMLARLRELLATSAMKPEPGPELMTVNDAAKTLGVSAKTVRRRIGDGTLPAVLEHGRIMLRADELHAYVEGLDRVGGRPVRRPPRRAARTRFEFLHHPGNGQGTA